MRSWRSSAANDLCCRAWDTRVGPGAGSVPDETATPLRLGCLDPQGQSNRSTSTLPHIPRLESLSQTTRPLRRVFYCPEGPILFYSLTKISRNVKLGPMPASTSSRSTCPGSCPLKGKGGCYAEYGPMSIFWGKVDRGEVGGDFEVFVKEVEQLPKRQIWRYGQAGDLPGEGDNIDHDQMIRLAKANRSRPVIAFTHKPPTPTNIATLKLARDLGFHVNLSANNVRHADDLSQHGLNVVVVLPAEYGREKGETKTQYRTRLNELPKFTPGGSRIAVCPATFTDTNCLQCGACARPGDRGAVIGFPAHGTKKKQVTQMALAPGETLKGSIPK